MNPHFSEIESIVRDFIAYTHDLNLCMQDDQRHFASHHFDDLEQSDLKKTQINAKLNEIINQLTSHSALALGYGDLFVKLSYYAATLESHSQNILLDLIQKMREEYKTGLQLMYLNRHVVNTNLAYMKELFSHLTQRPMNVKESTYDETGLIT